MSSVLGRRAELRVQQLTDADRAELAELVDADPFVNAVLASRLRALSSLHPAAFGGALYGARGGAGALTAAVFAGGNLLPVGGGPAEWQALADHLCRQPRPCTSIVGDASAVRAIRGGLAAAWGRERIVRTEQPLLALNAVDRPAGGDERVRAITADEVDRYLPAAAAMFEEELGVSPLAAGETEYRRRVTALVRSRRAFGIVEPDGRVLFKADIGAVSDRTCQLQGVWVRPDARGRGIGTAAMRVVLRHALSFAPTVSLYVNDFNVAARRMYARLGLRQVGTLATVLF